MLKENLAIHGPSCHTGRGIRGYGNPEHGVVLLGISPGKEESKTGRPMIGTSGRLIDNILLACNWSRAKTYATNIICYENRNPSFAEIMECRPRLREEMKLIKPKLVVLLGAVVGELFFPTRKYGTVRGSIDYYPEWNCYVLPTYHPAAILHGANEHITRDIIRDFAKISQFFDIPPQPEVKFKVINTMQEAEAIIKNLPTDKFIALDVETHLDKDLDENVPVEERVVCFSISDGDNTYWFPGDLLPCVATGRDINWTFHNGMFDTVALQEAIGGNLLPIKHDTMYMSYTLDERGGQHALKYLARENLAAGFYEEHSSAKKWADKLSDIPWLQEYNSKDSAYTARLATIFYQRMKDDDVLDVYNNLLLPAADIYRRMQQHGIYIDIKRYQELLTEYVPMHEQRTLELREEVARLGGNYYINLASPKQLREFLYGKLRLPGGPSTAAPIIEALAGEHDFINKLLDLRHLDKALNTYLVGAWDDIRRTRRIHPRPNLHSQVTGRVSYTPYSVNTLPRETNDNPYLAKIRTMFTAPDDDTILILLDYKQAEIFTAWFYCQDANMWTDLCSGDYHRATAAWILSLPQAEVRDGQRSDAKRTTFGQFFGIGIRKLALQTNKSVAEARAFQEGWDARYPGYGLYKEAIKREVRDTGELVTVTKRKRRFPAVIDDSYVNQAINYKIQSTSHDNLLAAIIEMYPHVTALGATPIIDLHDAVVIESPRDKAREVANIAREIMQKPRFGMPSIPVDVKMGYSLGEVEKMLGVS